ncbi:NAD(P)-dependent oxidoreductase [Arcobacter acticola]|uniref:NAD(P)-dependent oxidoreductase n=1 Tax=Arcobacter acticola TaxID=1849015 RepID=A0A6M8EM92_9BACT|nr:NAD(P)-dependent oxidoreductase [Arcobacter acticola]QKE29658.1 NAD(P)-dependent oxidoreductase [Arcobacter acticola]
MKILITGGSGFIGTRLIDELKNENHEIIIYDKVKSAKYPELTIVDDVRNREGLKKACEGIDIIYNLAAEHADNVTPLSLYAEVNIDGAKNIVEAAKANNINKIIFTSSVAIYGLNRGTPNEYMEAKPFNEYGRTKYEAEKIFLAWQKENEANNLQIVRPAVVFGEGNRGNVYNLINQIVSGKFAMIGDGLNKKSMGYVGNIAFFLSSLKNVEKKLDIFNFAGNNDLSTKEILNIVKTELSIDKKFPTIPYSIGIVGGFVLDIISKITGKKFPVSVVRIQKFTAETTVSTKHLFESGFKEKYTLEEGLRNMIKYEFKN